MIRQISISDITMHLPAAKKSGLTFCNNTKFYGLVKDNEIVAFAGILLYTNKAVFKNDYVLEKFRGQGYWLDLFQYRMNIVKKQNIKRIEATCTDMSIKHYIRSGFKVVKQFKKYTKVAYENI